MISIIVLKVRILFRFDGICSLKNDYLKSFRRASSDPETLLVAEEGVGDYLRQSENSCCSKL